MKNDPGPSSPSFLQLRPRRKDAGVHRESQYCDPLALAILVVGGLAIRKGRRAAPA